VITRTRKNLLKICCIAAAALAMMAPSSALAQSPVADVTTSGQLAEKEKELKQKALTSNGAASVKLTDYGNHYTMLAYRSKSGGAEVHAKFADIFYIIEGSGTLQTGGKLVDPTQANTDEPRGAAIEGASETPVHAGDVIHIPAGVPHRLLVPDGTDFCYYVIKVREQ
jgi:mannose-6-phosphate isomerase-like protein (cupin superfamily)